MHELERTQAFLEAMGVAVDGLNPELWLSASDRTFAARAVPDGGAIGFFIGAGSEWRRWPAARWIALGTRLRVRARHVLLLGGVAERRMASVVRDGLLAAGVKVRDLVGGTGVCELAACIARCRAVVSNDSSGLHLAVAQDVPTVGILGGYHFGRFYPWGDPAIHRVANVPMDCYHCNDACIYGDWRCVSNVSVDVVEQELETALG
jgi:ADP-heptose:LPS heptosyltransferase